MTSRPWILRPWLPVLCISIGSLSLPASPAAAQPPVAADTAGFDFLGFRPGLTQFELQERATEGGRGVLACRRATGDLRLSECRGGLPELDTGRSVDLWVSLVDGRAAITTLSGRLAAARFLRWRELLEGRYGPTPELRRGPIRMLQWVRDGRMVRLSWRPRGRDLEASVSLIDGPLLDGWANQGKRVRTPAP